MPNRTLAQLERLVAGLAGLASAEFEERVERLLDQNAKLSERLSKL